MFAPSSVTVFSELSISCASFWTLFSSWMWDTFWFSTSSALFKTSFSNCSKISSCKRFSFCSSVVSFTSSESSVGTILFWSVELISSSVSSFLDDSETSCLTSKLIPFPGSVSAIEILASFK